MKAWVSIFSLAALMFVFQNCSQGFQLEEIPLSESASLGSQTGDSSSKWIRTDLYLGGKNRIRKFSWDPISEALSDQGEISFPGTAVGWMASDSITQKFLAVDANGSSLQTYQRNSQTGSLAAESLWTVTNSSVHLSLARMASEILLFFS
ncbi:MAG: hypothetical protein ACAH59_03890, partial [Pseudobdellovibrionaceae bacterium]